MRSSKTELGFSGKLEMVQAYPAARFFPGTFRGFFDLESGEVGEWEHDVPGGTDVQPVVGFLCGIVGRTAFGMCTDSARPSL